MPRPWGLGTIRTRGKAREEREGGRHGVSDSVSGVGLMICGRCTLNCVVPRRPNGIYALISEVALNTPFQAVGRPCFVKGESAIELTNEGSFSAFQVIFSKCSGPRVCRCSATRWER